MFRFFATGYFILVK